MVTQGQPANKVLVIQSKDQLQPPLSTQMRQIERWANAQPSQLYQNYSPTLGPWGNNSTTTPTIGTFTITTAFTVRVLAVMTLSANTAATQTVTLTLNIDGTALTNGGVAETSVINNKPQIIVVGTTVVGPGTHTISLTDLIGNGGPIIATSNAYVEVQAVATA